MTTKQVTVTKYVTCSGIEFDSKRECENFEGDLKVQLQRDVFDYLKKINELKEAVNECRINAQIARIDAEMLRERAITATDKSRFYQMMATHFRWVSEYNEKRCKLSMVRNALRIVIDSQYLWFGKKSRKSPAARLERKRKSAMWRREHTPDQWRTPHKIIVSKLPGKDGE